MSTTHRPGTTEPITNGPGMVEITKIGDTEPRYVPGPDATLARIPTSDEIRRGEEARNRERANTRRLLMDDLARMTRQWNDLRRVLQTCGIRPNTVLELYDDGSVRATFEELGLAFPW